MLQEHVTQAEPGYLSFDIVPPFWFSDERTNTTMDNAFVVRDDGVVRTNIYLREEWSGRRFHFQLSVRDRNSDVTAHVTNMTVSCCHYLLTALCHVVSRSERN